MLEPMIEVRVSLSADGLRGAAEGAIVPGHAWASGVVQVRPSRAHQLHPGAAMPFHGMAQMQVAVEEALEAAGVTLHRPPGRPEPPRPALPVRRLSGQRPPRARAARRGRRRSSRAAARAKPPVPGAD